MSVEKYLNNHFENPFYDSAIPVEISHASTRFELFGKHAMCPICTSMIKEQVDAEPTGRGTPKNEDNVVYVINELSVKVTTRISSDTISHFFSQI
ncbi:hypothetical protein COW36_05275 [bacterium (Candidatus Blackallbacteria) CG17_big_fil_post_rev_8_21_14_2_50_48_46]|uniref:HMA domain-containing protein n=1 Tax=bacterium (Candidatus Blackallbacteria) CG17_big_fil_post_rev_8_21_14_2_50_48_46 TaxID=2014261 RepID=A0A2M7G9C4_9BACT|nr:MAG: hypothetical protein COW64_03665 [bacterium (Candidatus Blackallbacteria) CG18_big_fil_WC_8_21_14_2_50_49_26]PIW18708.1 MAG: hypothetical protein COW36_05275 [bacterium (Candidatus Blackallbacteria) CG17_big_fil_post_rev_8_21_14_2_50_48_46]